MTLSAVRRMPRELIGLYWDSGIANDVPALSWFLLSSLVPLALGGTALAAVLLGDYAQAQRVAERIASVLPKDAHDQIVELILRTKRDSPLLLVISIVGMIWMSSGIVGVLERCLLRLLARPPRGVVTGKLRNLGLSAVLAVVIVLMVSAATAGTGLVRRLHLDPTLTRLAVPLATLTITILLCALVYRALVGESLSWHAAFMGGMVGGIILQATPILAGYYLRFVAGRTPVELFLILTGVLVTCYVASIGLLLGAGVTARTALGHRLGAPPSRPDPPS
jgi:uncharacterized BrkB/YihY/UPF0761 family membrane protein